MDDQSELFAPHDPPPEDEIPEEAAHEWDSYEHILASEEGAVPVYGVQLLVFMDPEGRQHTRWCVDGSPDPDLLIGTLDRVKFFVHIQNLDLQITSTDDDELEDE